MKRFLDILIAAAVLIAAAPVMLVTAILVRWRLGSPVLFRQVRPGLGGSSFQLVKFRTMRDARDSGGKPLGDHERLTPFGKALRATSLDELPQLFNVLRGDMSLVGPRPLLMEYLPHYSPEQARRHDVRPGITGWAQVNGRNAISWEDKFRLDVWYVDNMSVRLDLKIMALTALRIIRRDGVNAAANVTMPRFDEEQKPAAAAPNAGPAQKPA
jgi:lipopolysaccharide/colanic/teichoic acid biosynthesis glycosyltransferase